MSQKTFTWTGYNVPALLNVTIEPSKLSRITFFPSSLRRKTFHEWTANENSESLPLIHFKCDGRQCNHWRIGACLARAIPNSVTFIMESNENVRFTCPHRMQHLSSNLISFEIPVIIECCTEYVTILINVHQILIILISTSTNCDLTNRWLCLKNYRLWLTSSTWDQIKYENCWRDHFIRFHFGKICSQNLQLSSLLSLIAIDHKPNDTNFSFRNWICVLRPGNFGDKCKRPLYV